MIPALLATGEDQQLEIWDEVDEESQIPKLENSKVERGNKEMKRKYLCDHHPNSRRK